MSRIGRGVAAIALWGSVASANPVAIAVTPILGAEAPAARGWSSYAVTVRGASDVSEKGTVALTDSSGGRALGTFAVAPGERVALELSWHRVLGGSLEAVARNDDGVEMARFSIPSPPSPAPLLFDLGRTERLRTALRDERVAALADVGSWEPAEGLDLAVTHATSEPASGELLLPTRALGYGAATVVLADSAVLAGMTTTTRDALGDWVLGGGTLAIAVSRPTDLASPAIVNLVGSAAAVVTRFDPAPFGDFLVANQPDAKANDVPPPSYFSTLHVLPGTDVASRLVGFTGATLHPTRFGAAATRGLGEVHLLAFDPVSPAFVDDPWVRRSIVDLVRQATERRTRVALGDEFGYDYGHIDPVRRLLDPNETHRWAITLAALVLLAYSLVALPLTFRRAARRNTPLGAIVELSFWSTGALALIVLIGAVAKGGRARARRLSFVECGSGANRCAISRFRSLFASSAASLRVSAADGSGLLDVAAAPNVERTLVLDRGPAKLVDLRGTPWATLVVREDAFTNLDGVIDVNADRIENHLSRALVGVVVRAPGDDLRYFPRVEPGATVEIAAGRALGAPPAAAVGALAPGMPPPFVRHRLETSPFEAIMNTTSIGLGDAWSALESGVEETDFWPAGATVLIAALDGGDGATDDTGLVIDRDRELVRVVGDQEVP